MILSELDPAVRDALLDAPLQGRTPHSVVNRQALRKLLQTIRSQGYAWCNQEFEIGRCTLSVPIRDDGGEAHAALCLHVPTCRIAEEQQAQCYLVPLREAASELSLWLK